MVTPNNRSNIIKDGFSNAFSTTDTETQSGLWQKILILSDVRTFIEVSSLNEVIRNSANRLSVADLKNVNGHTTSQTEGLQLYKNTEGVIQTSTFDQLGLSHSSEELEPYLAGQAQAILIQNLLNHNFKRFDDLINELNVFLENDDKEVVVAVVQQLKDASPATLARVAQGSENQITLDTIAKDTELSVVKKLVHRNKYSSDETKSTIAAETPVVDQFSRAEMNLLRDWNLN